MVSSTRRELRTHPDASQNTPFGFTPPVSGLSTVGDEHDLRRRGLNFGGKGVGVGVGVGFRERAQREGWGREGLPSDYFELG